MNIEEISLMNIKENTLNEYEEKYPLIIEENILDEYQGKYP